MRGTDSVSLAALIGLMLLGSPSITQAQNASADTTFFVTSVGSGKGADLGGLDGADRGSATI